MHAHAYFGRRDEVKEGGGVAAGAFVTRTGARTPPVAAELAASSRHWRHPAQTLGTRRITAGQPWGRTASGTAAPAGLRRKVDVGRRSRGISHGRQEHPQGHGQEQSKARAARLRSQLIEHSVHTPLPSLFSPTCVYLAHYNLIQRHIVMATRSMPCMYVCWHGCYNIHL